MWLSLQHTEPGDYVFATGKLHSVQDVVETAFATVNLQWKEHIAQDERFMRPAEPQRLVGDASKAAKVLNWSPEVSFDAMIREMTEIELRRLEGEYVAG